MSEAFQDYYEVLEVSRDATATQIRDSFRRLVLIWHPDKNPDGNEYIKKIYTAYEILSDPVKKADYDRTMANFTLTQPKSYFFMPSFSDDNAGKLKLACCVGGAIVVVAYATYKLVRQSAAPPLPLPLSAVSVEPPVEPIAVTIAEELNAPHPSSLWTLISWLAALRSKRILRNGKLTQGLASSISNSTTSSAANTIANALSSGARDRISSVATGMPKSINPGLPNQSAAANSVSQPLASVAENMLSSAAKVVPKTEGSSVIHLPPPTTQSSAASSVKSEKLSGYIFRQWSRIPSFANNVKPYTLAFKNNMVQGTNNALRWTALKTRPYIESAPNVINVAMTTASNASLKGASKIRNLYPKTRKHSSTDPAPTTMASKDTAKEATEVGTQLQQVSGLNSTRFQSPSPLKVTFYIGGCMLVLYGTYQLAKGYWSPPPPPLSKTDTMVRAMKHIGSASYDGIKTAGSASYKALNYTAQASKSGINKIWKYVGGS